MAVTAEVPSQPLTFWHHDPVETDNDGRHIWYPDYELPSYEDANAGLTVVQGTARRQNGYGTTAIDRWHMNDEQGTEYTVMRCLADNPRTDAWIVKDTAWSTQVTGLNTDVARFLMKIGFNVLIKGPEIGSSLPLSQSAYNTLSIIKDMERRGHMDASRVAIEGYSRGAMVAFGTNAYASKFGIDVLYSNLTDPCVGRPINVKHKVIPTDIETAKKAISLPADIALLGLAVAKGLADPDRGKHLLKTVDMSAKGARQFYLTGKPLMTGEAGMLATKTPHEMKATIAFFRRCRVNDIDAYQEILGNRPDVRFVRPAGGHGGGIDKRIIGNVAVRFGRLADQLEEGRAGEEIDAHYISYGPNIRPIR